MSSSEASESTNEELYEAMEMELDDDEIFQDLFSEKEFNNVNEYITFCKNQYHVDLSTIANDMYEWIRMVNFCRTKFKQGIKVQEIVSLVKNSTDQIFASNEYFQPVIENDGLLYSFDSIESRVEEDFETDPNEQIKLLQKELLNCKEKIRILLGMGDDGTNGDEAIVTTPPAPVPSQVSADEDYFNSYGELGIHEQMLKDKHRTESYRDALEEAVKHRGLESSVMDIGCGTGILCLFAARAGAASVVGIEASSMWNTAMRIIKKNHYEHVIRVVNSRVESLLPSDLNKIDILVSEWMGYGLLFESMLDSVLVARDQWLQEDGIMIPSRAAMYVQGQCDAARFQFWNDVYGFDYSDLAVQKPNEALVELVNPNTIISDRSLLYDIDLKRVTKEELDFTKSCDITFSKDSTLTSIVISWDCQMFGDIVLTTAVEAESTHWVHTILYLDDFIPVKAGEKVHVEIGYCRNKQNTRAIDIVMKINSKIEKRFSLK